MALNAFPGSSEVVFERSSYREWHNISGTADGRGDSLEQFALVLANQKQKKNSSLTIKNYLLKHNGVKIISLFLSLSLSISLSLSLYIYMNIYIDREREREMVAFVVFERQTV